MNLLAPAPTNKQHVTIAPYFTLVETLVEIETHHSARTRAHVLIATRYAEHTPSLRKPLAYVKHPTIPRY